MQPCLIQKIPKLGIIKVTGVANTSSPSPLHQLPFDQWIRTQCAQDAWILQHYTFVGDIEGIVESMGRGTLRAISDGSCDHTNSIGTSAWCVIGKGGIMRGVNIVPSSSDRMDSMRTELGGLYSIIRLVHLLSQYYDIRAGMVEIGSDCDTALNQTYFIHENLHSGL